MKFVVIWNKHLWWNSLFFFSQHYQWQCEFLLLLCTNYLPLAGLGRSKLFIFQYFTLKPPGQIKPNLAGIVLEWSPFKTISYSPTLHQRWPALLKINVFQLLKILHFMIQWAENKKCNNSYWSFSTFRQKYKTKKGWYKTRRICVGSKTTTPNIG